MPLDPRLRDYIHARLRGPLTPTRRPDKERVRTASPLLPETKRQYLRREPDPDIPELQRHPFEDDEGGDDDENEHIGGDDQVMYEGEDPLAGELIPTQAVRPRGSVIFRAIESVYEPKYNAQTIATAAVSNILTDSMPNFNPSIDATVTGRNGNFIRVRRLQVRMLFQRDQDQASGDVVRVVLVRDRQATTTPAWNDVFVAPSYHIHALPRPDARRRFQILFDRTLDLSRAFQSSLSSYNRRSMYIDVHLNDLYGFSASGFTPDMIRYRMFVVGLTSDGATDVLGSAMITYFDP